MEMTWNMFQKEKSNKDKYSKYNKEDQYKIKVDFPDQEPNISDESCVQESIWERFLRTMSKEERDELEVEDICTPGKRRKHERPYFVPKLWDAFDQDKGPMMRKDGPAKCEKQHSKPKTKPRHTSKHGGDMETLHTRIQLASFKKGASRSKSKEMLKAFGKRDGYRKHNSKDRPTKQGAIRAYPVPTVPLAERSPESLDELYKPEMGRDSSVSPQSGYKSKERQSRRDSSKGRAEDKAIAPPKKKTAWAEYSVADKFFQPSRAEWSDDCKSSSSPQKDSDIEHNHSIQAHKGNSCFLTEFICENHTRNSLKKATTIVSKHAKSPKQKKAVDSTSSGSLSTSSGKANQNAHCSSVANKGGPINSFPSERDGIRSDRKSGRACKSRCTHECNSKRCTEASAIPSNTRGARASSAVPTKKESVFERLYNGRNRSNQRKQDDHCKNCKVVVKYDSVRPRPESALTKSRNEFVARNHQDKPGTRRPATAIDRHRDPSTKRNSKSGQSANQVDGGQDSVKAIGYKPVGHSKTIGQCSEDKKPLPAHVSDTYTLIGPEKYDETINNKHHHSRNDHDKKPVLHDGNANLKAVINETELAVHGTKLSDVPVDPQNHPSVKHDDRCTSSCSHHEPHVCIHGRAHKISNKVKRSGDFAHQGAAGCVHSNDKKAYPAERKPCKHDRGDEETYIAVARANNKVFDITADMLTEISLSRFMKNSDCPVVLVVHPKVPANGLSAPLPTDSSDSLEGSQKDVTYINDVDEDYRKVKDKLGRGYDWEGESHPAVTTTFNKAHERATTASASVCQPQKRLKNHVNLAMPAQFLATSMRNLVKISPDKYKIGSKYSWEIPDDVKKRTNYINK